jgi:ribonuclease R
MKEGSIDFNVPSTKVLVNDLGEPTDIVNEERIFSHRLIEELMLLTNICASKFLDNKKVPQLYRIHETPDKENLSKLHLMLGSFLNTSIGKIKSSFDFQKLAQKLESVEDSNVSSIAQGFILRSMKQAQYSHQNLGHFGLNFTHYAHFTSPIRRYPDLVIHRQIKSVINKKYSRYLEEDVASMGTVLSAAEQRAVKAERKVVSVKKARFFESHVGEEFDGYISSIVKFGAFVTLREFPLDGLIKLDEIGDDHFVYDEETWTLRGRKTGKTFRVGDKVRIKVLNVDISDGKIDFSLLEHEGAKSKESFYDKFRADVVATNSDQKRYSSKDEIKKQNFKKEKSHRGRKKNKSKGGASSMFSSSSSARGLAFGKKRKKNRK